MPRSLQLFAKDDSSIVVVHFVRLSGSPEYIDDVHRCDRALKNAGQPRFDVLAAVKTLATSAFRCFGCLLHSYASFCIYYCRKTRIVTNNHGADAGWREHDHALRFWSFA